MKKIFTLAAAVLASFSLMAQSTIFSATPVATSEVNKKAAGSYELTSTEATISGGKMYMCHNDGTNTRKYIVVRSSVSVFCIDGSKSWFTVKLDEALQVGDTIITASETNGQGSSNARGIWVTTGETNVRPGSAPACSLLSESATGKEYVTVKYVVKTGDDICGKDSLSIWRATGNTTYFKNVIIKRPAPNTEPVAEVTISGQSEMFVGRTIKLEASTDVIANDYKWTVNGEDIEGATTSSYEFTPDAAGTFNFVCSAKNEFNSDWVASAAHQVVATVKPVLEQVSISEATVWDFSKAASVKEIKWEGDAKDADPIVMANIDGFNNNDDFNSQALLFSGEYPIRDGKYCQGPLLKFNTTVAGYLTIEYSNTGNRSAAEGETEGQEALRRFLAINGALVDGDEGSMKSSNNTITNNIPVAAGDVEISARMPYRTDEKDVNTPEYIRIYKVQFTLEEIPTAINNAEEAVKATKVIRNGQLFIEKNGVLYNAQGAIVK